MKITDLLDVKSILLDASPSDKTQALNQIIEVMAAKGNIRDKQRYAACVFEREKEGTTGIGAGIAIPHGKSDAVIMPGLAAMVIKGGVDFDSLDGEPATLIFLIAAPDSKDNVHLDVLSRLSRMLMDEDFAEALKDTKTPEEFLGIVSRREEEQEKKEAGGMTETEETGDGAGQAQRAPEQEQQPLILAVTACPTGIAHTYMAAEALEKAAKAAGCRIRVETRGSGGAKNVLSEAQIRQAHGIIIAADAGVPMERFIGKRLIRCSVSEGIHRPDELLERVLWGNAELYQGKSGPGAADSIPGTEKGPGAGHRIYTQLMNGVSHMLPFVVGGGILIAIAFLIDGLSVDVHTLTEAQRESFGSITGAAAVCKQIGGAAFNLMLPVLAGYIAMAISDRPALAAGFTGGVIAFSGNSGFLGALAAGFLAGYLVLGLERLCGSLPQTLEKIAPVLIYPVAGILLVGLAMYFIVEPVMGTINTALANGLRSMGGSSRILLGMVLGGMMSIDMGGPFNKAAYVFGTAAIASGSYDVMAAVMIGGMIPPCGIALATVLFRDRFTKEEREAGPTNFIMGLAFITEGAIPFAAADPVRVLPACIIGSAVSGALSMAFGCTLMAPHGGIFVFPVVGNALLYTAALAVGVVVTAVLLGLLKSRKKG